MFLTYFQNQNIASQLTAVQNGSVYRAGGFHQGSIINLKLTERPHSKYIPPSLTVTSNCLTDKESPTL